VTAAIPRTEHPAWARRAAAAFRQPVHILADWEAGNLPPCGAHGVADLAGLPGATAGIRQDSATIVPSAFHASQLLFQVCVTGKGEGRSRLLLPNADPVAVVLSPGHPNYVTTALSCVKRQDDGSPQWFARCRSASSTSRSVQVG
jgi:hypothetical protein